MQRQLAENDLRIAAEAVETARAGLVNAIRNARRAGMSYREIAAVIGMSHEGVRRLADADDGGTS